MIQHGFINTHIQHNLIYFKARYFIDKQHSTQQIKCFNQNRIPYYITYDITNLPS